MNNYILAVINTATPSFCVAHDAAKPYAIAELGRKHGQVKRIVKRYASYHGASVACGKLIRKNPTLGER